MIFVLYGTSSPASVYIFAVLYGFFSGTLISMSGACVARICKDLRTLGTMMGMFSGFSSIGALVGTPIAGALVRGSNYDGSLIFGACVMTAGGILSFGAKLVHSRGKFWYNI